MVSVRRRTCSEPRMLNKEVCKCCIKKYENMPWSSISEFHWEESKMVACPWIDRRDTGYPEGPQGPGTANIKDNPPEWCPYAAEHVVSQDVE